ncbi:MAG: hypothetical protein RL518_1659 [Pseudomonadota bacterium]|jgi:hypothetical protein
MKVMEYIRPGALVTRGYAERLLQGISPTIFGRYPVVNGTQIASNHPAFVFGHLALYPTLIAELSGISTRGMEIPASYPDLFKMGVPCHDDPSGTIYPPMEEIVNAFFRGTDALIASLDSIAPEALDILLEHPSRRERFGTVGAFLAYILLAHPQSHLGQVSAWRRCMGLGPV